MRERLLVRHFLQRFLDHDLISPHADRHEVLTITCATLVASSLFLAVLLAVKYQFNLFLPPGLTAILALDDRFLFIAVSMIVMGLVAVTEWDALALDARDSSVLGPLPIPRAVIVRAKFLAVALFAVGFAVAWNLAPTLLRPVSLPVKLPVTIAGAFRLMVGHAVSTLAAGAFGFVAVLGLRETLRAILGPTGFRRISAGLQASLVVFFVTTLLLLPGAYAGVASFWLAPGRMTPWVIPPLWFVGLHETLAGDVIDRLPRGVPPRMMAVAEPQATALYRSLQPLFHDLATTAVLALVIISLITTVACVWNSRRLATPLVKRDRGDHALGKAFVWIATHLIVRVPAAQAGFFFALQSLSRSAPHRVTMASSLAVGLALLVVSLSGSHVHRAMPFSSLPVAMLAGQTLLIAALLTGFRHAVRVPADLRANWTFHLSWSGDERPYLTGVKRAGFLALVVPTLALLSVSQVFVLGSRTAVEHFACGLLVALLLMDGLFLGFRKLPFASGYVPTATLKSLAALYAVALLVVAFALAWLEREALATTVGSLAFVVALATLCASVRAVDVVQRRTRVMIDLDEHPPSTTQVLELIR